MLKLIGAVIFAILIILSIIPYFLPLKELPGRPFEPFYDNSRIMTIEGTDLHYRQWGVESAEGVLLVHGFSGSTFSWRYTAPALAADGCRIIAVDLPGFGLSERDLSFTPTAVNRADLLWGLLESLEPGSNWHLVGHSMGAVAWWQRWLCKDRNRCKASPLLPGRSPLLAADEPAGFSTTRLLGGQCATWRRGFF